MKNSKSGGIVADENNGTGAETHLGLVGAHLDQLCDPDGRGGLRVSDVFDHALGSSLIEWHRIVMQHGDREFFGNHVNSLDPPLDALLAVPTTSRVPSLGPSIAEALAAKGIDVPGRAGCVAWDKADRAAGGLGGDADLEYAYVTYCLDPELPGDTAQEYIGGVPKSICDGWEAEEKTEYVIKAREGKVIASPSAPSAVAAWVLRSFLTTRDLLPGQTGRRRRLVPMYTVARIGGMWCQYTAVAAGEPPRWVARTDPEWMRGRLREVLRDKYYVKMRKPDNPVYDLKPWTANLANLREVEAALIDMVTVVDDNTGTAARELPDAYGRRHGMYPSTGTWTLCCNGVLDLGTGNVVPNTPLWFSLTRVEADYDHALDPDARGTEWTRMLLDQWADDPGAIACLGEWFGYVLSGRMDLQKAMFILGPGASGKGNIAAVLEALISGATSTDMHRLNTNFGLSKLYQSGATLAVMGDVRFNAPDATQAVQNLLSIIGQDMVPVDIKYKDEIDALLPVRFHMSANEFPNIPDNAAAIARRLLLLKTARSFAGNEDSGLRERIIAQELGHVLRWAVAGLERLNHNGGKFTASECHTEMHARIKELMSPTLVFVHECCTPGDAHDYVTQDEIYRCWCLWAAQNNHKPGSKTRFIERLTALPDFPGLRGGKGREAGRVVYGIAAARTAANVFVP
ncbi:phage/plasmid primase, P4 family [Mycobacteroides chelonae]|uniref:DNA primase family protein n=1 Tax=Mycobacteroides chelonae TaxID=1774 RepID=UPI0009932E42|nr:phage/plasmid primase, P4 family [Mycobacteroides chelonae]MEC4858342.1 phage/plasmid primase, P4 family [Mycobacteroides chelonae]MEC4870624.1 phage/plasmid primase, P4 family [Mycobacteroides chelonae]